MAGGASSQNVAIIGNAEKQSEKLVRVITYADGFSNLEKTIAETITDELGGFTLQFEINQTQFGFFALGLEKAEFYLTPGANYNINIPLDTLKTNGSIFDRLPLNLRLSTDDGGVQNSIEEFNSRYNDFIYNNISSIYKSRNKSIVSNFVAETNSKFESNNSVFVKNYIDYSLASLLWLSKKENNQKILNKYFINKPVLYSNIQYTDFFKEFFKDYFNSENTFRYEELIPAINSNESLEMLDNLLKRDSLLVTDARVREIVQMLLLSRNYHDRYVEKERVISKYLEIADKSEYPENRDIALNFITKLETLQSGTIAPDFALADIVDSIVSLGSLKGKFVLLNFINNNCKICEFHLQLIKDIRAQNDNSFEIITILAGNEIAGVYEFAKNNGFDWPILKTGKDILLLEKYNIRAFPSYILINPDGTLAYAHLPMPDENLELYLQRFIDRYNQSNNNN